MSLRIAILAYHGIEPVDIGATYGVFSMARRIAPDLEFWVISRDGGELEMANGLRLIADHGFADCPVHDILLVLGGPGWEDVARDATTLDFIRDTKAGTIASVCTGAMILGAAGVLDGRKATTKREILPGEARPLDLLVERARADVREARIVDDGTVITGGGVSLGIDLSLHLLERFIGPAIAGETARILEYGHARAANAAALGDILA